VRWAIVGWVAALAFFVFLFVVGFLAAHDADTPGFEGYPGISRIAWLVAVGAGGSVGITVALLIRLLRK
jgi:hypothetical protein